ncbi:MAG: hypothetical protein M1828_002286 [Chrysothrix sp. TS-e1954]|nr:MAG: hypothetical protein M1828_002286 [Chrysothrix sp. TS-e1954]
MPPRPGDKTLLVAYGDFADVHYWITPPSQKPPHHRFEKGSYVYLHHNPSTRKARVEVANNAGTAEQDAFEGSLEHANIKYSHKRPAFLTLEVTIRTSAQDQMWQLKTFDMQHQSEYLYLLSVVDIYFWNPADALKFVESAQGLHVGAIAIQDAPAGTQNHQRDPSGTMSPVVQKLEQVAIATPYQHSQSQSTSTTQSFPPPPPAPGQTSSTSPSNAADSYGPPPAAYNPAAPAAPEPISHRDKTPPPLEIEDGPQQPSQYGQPYQQILYPHHPTHHSYHHAQQTATSPPSNARQNSIGPFPPQGGTSPAGVARTGSFPAQAGTQQSFSPPPSNPYNPTGTPTPSSGYPQRPSMSSQSSQQYAGYSPQSPGHHPSQSPLASPTHLPGPPPPPQSPGYNPSAHSRTPPGYSQGGYASPPPLQQQTSAGQVPQAHEIHNQVYIPTEAEYSKPAPAGSSGNVGRLEKGVNKWLKRLDKCVMMFIAIAKSLTVSQAYMKITVY